MNDSVFRIHPAIGFARVGNSKEYYLGPETLTGHKLDGSATTGGLPIKAGTESDTVRSGDLRDRHGAMKRQAARFRIYVYEARNGPETYPMGQAGTEVRIGSKVRFGGATRTVSDIVWTVHLANKKTAWYESPDDDGIIAWFKVDSRHPKPTPPLRNQSQGEDPNDLKRLKKLVTDPGPRTIRGKSAPAVDLDRQSAASYWQDGKGITDLPDYPKTFPGDAFDKLNPPGVEVIDTLGTIETDPQGRLIVAAGFGRANSFSDEAPDYHFYDAVNNDCWFDDTGDGPVNAVLLLDDGSAVEAQGGAWVVCTDPAYAPQIPNVVSLWDDIYDSWVRKLELRPELFARGKFNDDYKPSFEDEVRPIFLAAGLQRWITNLNMLGISAHDRVARISADKDPAQTQLHGLGLIRKPVDPDALTLSDPRNPDKIVDGRGDPERSGDERRMPLGLGDAGRSLLSLSQTQYHYLERWDRNDSAADERIELNAGEKLDKAALLACLGGRFSPGIDMTYICRETDLYVKDWQTSGTGPFRIRHAKIDYDAIGSGPVLATGWTPRRDQNELQPGDISKFMAVPWHADYNSCGTHLPAPNLRMANTLYWSWPAQRPVAVYVAKDIRDNGKRLADQRYSMRGPGTKTAAENPPPFGPADPSEVGRFQKQGKKQGGKGKDGPGIMRILDHWMEIGTVMQATNIDPKTEDLPAELNLDPGFYLEVQSCLSDNPDDSDVVVPWPNTARPAEPGSD